MSLSERAILTHLTISVWSGTVGRNPDDTNNLDPDRDRIIHSVIPKNLLEPIHHMGREIRRVHYKHTAPWDDNGLRLVPSQNLLEYSNIMRQRRDVFDRLVEAKLPGLKAAIEAEHADRFADLASRFGTRLTFYPVPDGDKMPLMVNTVEASVRDAITKSMNADTQMRTAEIVADLKKAVVAQCQRMQLPDRYSTKYSEIYASTTLVINTLVAVDPQYQSIKNAFDQHDLEYITATLGVQNG